MTAYFSTIYNNSFEFLTEVSVGLSRITDHLFLPLRNLIAPIFGQSPENYLPNVAFLNNSVITYVVGSGLILYIGLALWKFIQDAIS